MNGHPTPAPALLARRARPRAEQALKADRLLLAGAVRVQRRTPSSVFATVQGDSGRYECGWSDRTGWWCTCPSRDAGCSHLLAVRRVVPAGRGRGAPA